MEENWLKKMSQEQLEAMLQDIENEIENRKFARKAQAWEKVKSAIEEYLEIDSSFIEIQNEEYHISFNKDTTIDMGTLGSILISSW